MSNPIFANHEFRYFKDEYCTIFELKHKKYNQMYRVRFTNTDGKLLVTGDYGNWVFDREFHPSANKSDRAFIGYFLEKLRTNSAQDACVFNSDVVSEQINEIILDEEIDLTDDEFAYLKNLLTYTEEYEYIYHAIHDSVGRFKDGELIPRGKTIKPQLQHIFDAFNEMCDRLIDHDINEFLINKQHD